MRRLLPLVLFFVLWVPAAHAWTWPVEGPVLQGYSYDAAHPYAGGQHRGIDIGASATGIPVLAPATGTVTYAGSIGSNGKTLTIETADGLAVTLTHLGSIAVARDDAVTEGETIGTVGPTGTPEFDGPYVHLGIRLADDAHGYLDPLSLLPVAPAPSTDDPPAQDQGTGSQDGAPPANPTSTDQTSTDQTSSDPPSTDPTSTEPTSTEPASTDQASTEPAATEPTSTDQTSTEPAATDPAPEQTVIDDSTQAEPAQPAPQIRTYPPWSNRIHPRVR